MRRITGGAELAEVSRDAGTKVIIPKVAFFASSEEEALSAFREAESEGLVITPRGAGTGIPTQSVGSGAVIVQEGGSATLSGEVVTCAPGVVKAELNRYLAQSEKWVPVDPSSYASCTVGGMVANNSSGARTLKYGSIMEYVDGLRVVPPGGGPAPLARLGLEEETSGDPRAKQVASLLVENKKDIGEEAPRVTKNSSGYRLEKVVHDGVFDLPRLFVGSEGTLGFMTQVSLRTRKRPRWRLLFVVETTLSGLDRSVAAFRALGPAALELVDKSVFRRVGKWEKVAAYSRSEEQYLLFCEFDGEGSQEGTAEMVASSPAAGLEPIVLSDPGDIQKAWDVRSETLSLAQDMREGSRSPAAGVEDLVVPPERLGDLVRLLTDQFERRGLGYTMYGHAGDANLHARPLVDLSAPGGVSTMKGLMDECFEAVWRMGGSMTGEHGDGMLRAQYVERQYPRTYWIMQEIKSLYDPKGIMNPGVKVPLPSRP